MKSFLKNNSLYLGIYIIYLLLTLPVILIIPKVELHLILNQYYTGFTDGLFKNLTYMGSGVIPAIVAVLFLFVSFRKSAIIASSAVTTGIIVQFMKRLIFSEMLRPINYFATTDKLHLVNGMDIHSNLSFPSGHSATIFALTLCLTAFSNRKILKFILFWHALLVAYSRVYLSQHFLIDIYFGSIIGVVVASASVILFNRVNSNWMDRSLVFYFKPRKADE